MNIKIFNENKIYPFIVVDDWYNEKEEKIVWKELDYFYNCNVFESAEENCAIEGEKKLAKNNRLYYDLIFKNKKYSFINKMLYKIQNKNFHKIVEDVMPVGKIFKHTNWDNTLVNYYENDDNYEDHYDYSLFTMLIFFFKSPKMFSGGDLYFKENNTTVECKHNRMLLFPGYYYHKVNKVSMQKKYLNDMNGRFSITHFISRIDT
jgi:Rps23 Pro-64 3,4-dihydroxylase Tpa1-like proline 4-hydroxylase